MPPPPPPQRAVDRVTVKFGDEVELKNGRTGIVRYIGSIHIKKGIWIGIELSEPNGNHDGELNGKRYFQTAPNHGTFVKHKKVVRVIKPALNLASHSIDDFAKGSRASTKHKDDSDSKFTFSPKAKFKSAINRLSMIQPFKQQKKEKQKYAFSPKEKVQNAIKKLEMISRLRRDEEKTSLNKESIQDAHDENAFHSPPSIPDVADDISENSNDDAPFVADQSSSYQSADVMIDDIPFDSDGDGSESDRGEHINFNIHAFDVQTFNNNKDAFINILNKECANILNASKEFYSGLENKEKFKKYLDRLWTFVDGLIEYTSNVLNKEPPNSSQLASRMEEPFNLLPDQILMTDMYKVMCCIHLMS